MKTLVCLVVMLVGLVVGNSNGAITIDLYEQGSDVIMELSGSTTVPRDTWTSLYEGPKINPSNGLIVFDDGHGLADQFFLDGAFPDFGSGLQRDGELENGSSLFCLFPAPVMLLQSGYHGTPLSGKVTFANTTVDALGAWGGVYSQTFGGGADTLTLNVIPEPSGAILIAGIGGLGVFVGRRFQIV